MRSFRFPRSTIFLMVMILTGVIVAIEKGRNLSMGLGAANGNVPSSWSVLPGVFATVFVVMSISGAIGYVFLVLLRRAGAHRPDRKNV
jgi:hypothetical protein